jgi:ACR3 family arsenite efflux pump ArsB
MGQAVSQWVLLMLKVMLVESVYGAPKTGYILGISYVTIGWAVAVGAFQCRSCGIGSGAALATVIGPLLEIPLMVTAAKILRKMAHHFEQVAGAPASLSRQRGVLATTRED